MSRPAISILLPAFDAADTLDACLRSITRQSDPDWECVVVDDGSQDGTLDCARRFAQRDPRFVVVGQPHRGIVATLNTGLERCRGRFVARMDADDVMHSQRLACQRAALENGPELTAVGCHVRLFPRGEVGPGMREYEQWLNQIRDPRDVQREAFVECPVAHPSLFMRSESLIELGYRDVDWPEDYDLVLRCLAAGHPIGVVPRRLVAWRVGADRLSQNHPRYAIPRFTACKAHFLATGLLAQAEEYILWGFGGTGRLLRKALLAEGKRPAHIVELHPGRLGEVIHGALVIRPEQLTEVARRPIVVSVAGATARSEIRGDLHRMGFSESHHYVCAA